ncbi:Transmembrane amino acid transporter family protein isoform 2 [Hibiscus syriacus]|uniref:Transmembrane amino acid transporter family protein isoform 2 n=1 Tax=Hibiscus syriacus TaxID=106335 RepID=A0A6A2Z5I4_HIBSY|nr:Transmembrane amino acid transporter family protein isoform 2 [Hibiscus syriacus]
MSLAAGVNAPLLSDSRKSPAKSPSVSGAVINVSTSIIGAGIMSIPATLKELGVIPAFVMIPVLAWQSERSVEFLMRYTRARDTTTYAGVMREFREGRIGPGDVLSGNQPEGSVHLGVLQQWFGIHWWNSSALALLFTLVFVLLPLVIFKRIDRINEVQFCNISFLAVVFVGINSVMAIMALFKGKTNSPRLVPELDDKASFFELFTAVPVIVTAFTFHFNASSYMAAIAIPNKWYFFQFTGSTSAMSLGFIFPVPLLLGVLGAYQRRGIGIWWW